MRGTITRRGKTSWRLKFDVEPKNGRRETRYVTVRGKRPDAERELTRLLAQVDAGTLPEVTNQSVSAYIRAWLENDTELSPRTKERYLELLDQYIAPSIGATKLQRLRPAMVATWHTYLLKTGGKDARPLSARTVGHAHRLLHRALERAVGQETLSRNVASIIAPPKVLDKDVRILNAEEIAEALTKFDGHDLSPLVVAALGTGARRGELLAIQWGDLDLDARMLSIVRTLEETNAGLRLKPPKTKAGRRSISLPRNVVVAFREHRVRQLQSRLALGMGRPEQDALVFCNLDGSPLSPRKLSRDWLRACAALRLPRVMFHGLRHSHASALIAAGVDVVSVATRLGHAKPSITLTIYAHAFQRDDSAAALAIEAVMRTRKEL
jgi:integrase